MFLWCVFGLGLVIGYVAVYFDWMVYAQPFHVADGNGAKPSDWRLAPRDVA